MRACMRTQPAPRAAPSRDDSGLERDRLRTLWTVCRVARTTATQSARSCASCSEVDSEGSRAGAAGAGELESAAGMHASHGNRRDIVQFKKKMFY